MKLIASAIIFAAALSAAPITQVKLVNAGSPSVIASSVKIDGDTASARTLCHNPMIMDGTGGQTVMFVGIWYHDTFVRTADGWRISSRREEKGYMYGLPGSP